MLSIFLVGETKLCENREKDEICLNQLHQWQLWQRELGSEARLPDYLAERCYNTFRSRPTLPSGFQPSLVLANSKNP